MGAIQNSINSVLGTATVLAAGGKKLKTDAEALESAKMQEKVTLTEAVPKLEEDIGAQEEAVTDALMDSVKAKQKYKPELDRIAESEKRGFESDEQAASAAARQEEIGIELQKRETALKAAQGKLDAMKMQRQLYAERLAKLTGGKK